MTSPTRAATLPTLAAGCTVVLWASAFVVIRAAGDSFEPGALALGRQLVATIVLGAMVVRTRESWPTRRDLTAIAVCGVLWFGVYNVALNAAEQRIDAGTASMLVNLGPILIAVIAGIALGEGFPRSQLLGIAVAFAGVIIIGVGSADGGTRDLVGVALAITAAVAYAIAVVVQKPVLARVSALRVTFLASVCGALATMPFAPQLAADVPDAAATDIAGLIFLGVFATAIAFTTWAYALARTTASKQGATTYLVPAVAILLAWFFLDETPTWFSWIGGALCLAGVAITRSVRSPARRSTPVRP